MICPSTAQRLFRPDGSNNNIDFIFLNIFDIRSILVELILHFKFLLAMNVCNPKGSAAMVHLCVYMVVFLARFFYFSHIYPPDSEDRFFVLTKEKSSDSEHLKMFKEVLLSSEALKPKLDRCLKVCHCFILRHASCIYRCIAVRSSRSQLITPLMGQSIFTLFASLA